MSIRHFVPRMMPRESVPRRWLQAQELQNGRASARSVSTRTADRAEHTADDYFPGFAVLDLLDGWILCRALSRRGAIRQVYDTLFCGEARCWRWLYVGTRVGCWMGRRRRPMFRVTCAGEPVADPAEVAAYEWAEWATSQYEPICRLDAYCS
jgi:hypothetical protein